MMDLAAALSLRARTAGWLVDGRPIRPSEMDLLSQLARYEREQRIDANGCCCEAGPWTTGKCRHLPGLCKRFELAAAMLRRHGKG